MCVYGHFFGMCWDRRFFEDFAFQTTVSQVACIAAEGLPAGLFGLITSTGCAGFRSAVLDFPAIVFFHNRKLKLFFSFSLPVVVQSPQDEDRDPGDKDWDSQSECDPGDDGEDGCGIHFVSRSEPVARVTLSYQLSQDDEQSEGDDQADECQE